VLGLAVAPRQGVQRRMENQHAIAIFPSPHG
jgi:hypothetical protein